MLKKFDFDDAVSIDEDSDEDFDEETLDEGDIDDMFVAIVSIDEGSLSSF